MKYPTRAGLIVSPYEFYTPPTEVQLNTRRATTVHHGYFERRRYRDNQLQQIFRSLITNTYPLLVTDHIELHEEFCGPIIPRPSLMVEVLDQYAEEHGQLDLIYEKRTRQSYVMGVEQYQLIREGRSGQIN